MHRSSLSRHERLYGWVGLGVTLRKGSTLPCGIMPQVTRPLGSISELTNSSWMISGYCLRISPFTRIASASAMAITLTFSALPRAFSIVASACPLASSIELCALPLASSIAPCAFHLACSARYCSVVIVSDSICFC
jgi:hypothetical protein